MIFAACASLAAILATAQGGETIALEGDCGPIEIAQSFPRRVTIAAEHATVKGLALTGRNITWRGGILTATDGMTGTARRGYAVYVSGQDITVSSATITDARMGMVVTNARNVGVYNSRFWRLRSDGLHTSRTVNLSIEGNTFSDFRPLATDHPDAIQMRDGVTNARIRGNVVRGDAQGIAQMDTTGDLPLALITISGNRVSVAMYHQITLGDCTGCGIEGNVVRRGHPERKAVIRAGSAVRCGNDVQDEKPDAPC